MASPNQKGVKKMAKKKGLYLTGGIILILIVVMLVLNMNRFFITEEEKQNEVVAAIQSEDIDHLNKLIKKDYPLTFLAKEGNTPLEMALNQRSFPMATLLLQNNAEVNEEKSPLYVQIVSKLDDFHQIGENLDYQETVKSYIELLT